MTIKMLIVDDEPVICQGLRHTIPWECLGVEIVGEAYDGLQALQMIGECEPDLVLTDVKMPKMDGLALAEALANQKPHVRVVMISGYDEFDYARQAIRLGVEDYLLKPVDIDELVELVTRLASIMELEKVRRRKEHFEKLVQWCAHHVTGSPSHTDSMDESKFLTTGTFVHMIVSELDDYASLMETFAESEMELIRKKWSELVNQFLQSSGLEGGSVFLHENRLLSICFCEEETAPCDHPLSHLLNQAVEEWDGPDRIRFGTTASVQETGQFREAYRKAAAALRFKVVNENPILWYERDALNDYPARPYPEDLEKQLLQHLFNHVEVGLVYTVQELFRRFLDQKYLLEEILYVHHGILIMIDRRLRAVGMKGMEENDGENSSRIDLRIYNTYASLEKIILADLFSKFAVIQSANMGKNRWVIERIKKYITDHYNQELKASYIANMVRITPNYFSLMFKHETGKSFNEFLNELRVDKAKHFLLDTPDKVFEIAERVGYTDYKYFIHVFKKITGITPSDYREINHVNL